MQEERAPSTHFIVLQSFILIGAEMFPIWLAIQGIVPFGPSVKPGVSYAAHSTRRS